MKVKKLPSGSWRAQVYAGTEKVVQPDGSVKVKNVMKSFTVKDPSPRGKRECERLAAEWAAGRHADPVEDITLGDAMDRYIDARTAVLSPRTVMSYKSIRQNYLSGIMDSKLSEITQEDIQQEINSLSASHSPKTVRNIHGLLTAVLHAYRPDFAVHTVMPKSVRPDLYIPSDGDIQCLMDSAAGTNMELPILLAAFGPMRRGEICALESSDINGNVVHVHRNMVKSGKGDTWTVKAPKSYAGDRYIDYPDFVAEKWKGIDGRIVKLCPDTITKKFELMLDDADLPHFRFHDLRHYAASVQHAIGVPDVYIMQRGGWGNDGTLKSVYRHAMDDRQAEMSEKTNKYFTELEKTSHETSHEKQKSP